MTFEVSKEIEFDAGHRVPNHNSKCRNPHGHRYKVRATISGALVTTPGASNEGMLADFGDLKQILTEKVHDAFDHGFIVWDGDNVMLDALAPSTTGEWFKVIVVDYIPTAENLAQAIFIAIENDIVDMGFDLVRIDVWETPTSIATFRR